MGLCDKCRGKDHAPHIENKCDRCGETYLEIRKDPDWLEEDSYTLVIIIILIVLLSVVFALLPHLTN
jgi:hypothetical protein